MDNIRIDLNCDMGESYGHFKIGNDPDIMPLVSSCNIACGYHGGDPYTIERTIDLALSHGVFIGAHPAYPDLIGFGRRAMKMDTNDFSSMIKYQVGAIKSMVESKGGHLTHIKAHGALYNEIAFNMDLATHFFTAIAQIAPDIPVMVLAGSDCENFARRHDIKILSEAFIDRSYLRTNQLCPRDLPNSVITDKHNAWEHLQNMVLRDTLITIHGERVTLTADTYCIHGDNPKALEILQYIHTQLEKHSILLRKPIV